jgi:CO/xanthine dehydrogenase FAD-binding subunit
MRTFQFQHAASVEYEIEAVARSGGKYYAGGTNDQFRSWLDN